MSAWMWWLYAEFLALIGRDPAYGATYLFRVVLDDDPLEEHLGRLVEIASSDEGGRGFSQAILLDFARVSWISPDGLRRLKQLADIQRQRHRPPVVLVRMRPHIAQDALGLNAPVVIFRDPLRAERYANVVSPGWSLRATPRTS